MQLEFIDDVLNRTRDGEDCAIHGRVVGMRNHGGLVFLDIADHTGKVQIVADWSKLGDKIDELHRITEGAYVHVRGTPGQGRRGQREITSSDVTVLAHSTINVSPKPWAIDGLDPDHGSQVFSHPEFYVANRQREAVFTLKSELIAGMHEYYQKHRFTLVEPPILTNKTLYGAHNAISAKVHGEEVFLSQCATFELEPLALAFGKVYTISPAFRNEPGGSKRHLAEYTHAKAEVLLADLDDLKALASDAIYAAVAGMISRKPAELELVHAAIDLEALHPASHEHITYDDAVAIVQQKGSAIVYGEGLSHTDEKLLTTHLGNKYVWVQFPPRNTEGFPYRKNPENPSLAMVADLIAPHGAGEMVGVAEKITDAEELIEGIIDKGLQGEISQYWDYILLRHFGLPPHGGVGAAPERIIYGLLGLDHVRLTKPWPRYPDRNIRAPERLETFGDAALEKLIDTYKLAERKAPAGG